MRKMFGLTVCCLACACWSEPAKAQWVYTPRGRVIAAPYVASPYVASPYVASPYVASPLVVAPAPAFDITSITTAVQELENLLQQLPGNQSTVTKITGVLNQIKQALSGSAGTATLPPAQRKIGHDTTWLSDSKVGIDTNMAFIFQKLNLPTYKPVTELALLTAASSGSAGCNCGSPSPGPGTPTPGGNGGTIPPGKIANPPQ